MGPVTKYKQRNKILAHFSIGFSENIFFQFVLQLLLFFTISITIKVNIIFQLKFQLVLNLNLFFQLLDQIQLKLRLTETTLVPPLGMLSPPPA